MKIILLSAMIAATVLLVCCSVERNIIIMPNDTASPPNATLPSQPLHPNLEWPTRSGITETQARRICQAPIVQTPIFELCRKFTVESLTVITESCMLDLQVRKIIHSSLQEIYSGTR